MLLICFKYKYLYVQTIVGHLLLYIGLLINFFKSKATQKLSFV